MDEVLSRCDDVTEALTHQADLIALFTSAWFPLGKWCSNHPRILEAVPTYCSMVEGRRQRSRPKLRWEDGVMEDARKLEERSWRNAARNRDSWQKLLKKALARKGLLCQ